MSVSMSSSVYLHISMHAMSIVFFFVCFFYIDTNEKLYVRVFSPVPICLEVNESGMPFFAYCVEK